MKKIIKEQNKNYFIVDFSYRIREDATNSVVADYGVKKININLENYRKLGSYIWNNIVGVIDRNVLFNYKKDTNIKFYIESDFNFNNNSYTIRIYFDITKDKNLLIVGWSFEKILKMTSSLEELNLRLSKIFEKNLIEK